MNLAKELEVLLGSEILGKSRALVEQHLTPKEFLRCQRMLQYSISPSSARILRAKHRTVVHRHRWAPEVPIAHLVVTQSGHHRVRFYHKSLPQIPHF